jgi:hypothetical protein
MLKVQVSSWTPPGTAGLIAPAGGQQCARRCRRCGKAVQQQRELVAADACGNLGDMGRSSVRLPVRTVVRKRSATSIMTWSPTSLP